MGLVLFNDYKLYKLVYFVLVWFSLTTKTNFWVDLDIKKKRPVIGHCGLKRSSDVYFVHMLWTVESQIIILITIDMNNSCHRTYQLHCC